ncbi:nucleoside triphosphate pyrophosphohydrolase family protein [Candidatus Saccharibacteria bacterium]|nr:nucleoside triphosphate pyrophosphohydrolase family protein [Candidatus Saccharibacteria bacterium]
MDFDEYQRKAATTDLDADSLGEVMRKRNFNTVGFLDKALGVAGEAGEFADKVKKILRDKKGAFTDEDKDAIIKELGDVLWYVALVSLYLDVPLSRVAELNIEKLASRAKRNTLTGEGDER